MIEQDAVVVRADADIAVVEAVRRSACGGCNAAAACGTSLLDRFFGRRPLYLTLRNHLAVAVGDTVVIGIREDSMLRAALAAYIGPLLGLMLGALAGRHLPLLDAASGSDWPSLLGACVGFVLALRVVARYSRALARDPRFRPVLLRRSGPVSMPVSFG